MEVLLYLKGRKKGINAGASLPCQQSLSFTCLIFAYSRKTRAEWSKIFVEYAWHVTNIIVSNSGLLTVRLIRQARLSLYQ